MNRHPDDKRRRTTAAEKLAAWDAAAAAKRVQIQRERVAELTGDQVPIPLVPGQLDLF